MALDITSQEFLQQQLLSRDPIRDRGWSEALNIIDTWDRDAADACEAVLKIYEAEHDSQSARTWEKLVISMARDPRNLAVLHEHAKRALTNLSLAAVPQETRAQRAAKLVEEAKAKAAQAKAQAAQAAQAAKDAQAAKAAQVAQAAQAAQAAQVAQAAQTTPTTQVVKPVEEITTEGSLPPRTWDITRAPFSYHEIQRLGPWLRLSFGFVMIAYSNIAITSILGWLLLPVLPQQIGFVFVAHIVGLLLGLSVTVGQWTTRKAYPRFHWFLVLCLDAPFSGYLTLSWVSIIAEARFAPPSGMTLSIWLVCVLIAVGWGVLSAKFGEFLLLGYKRTR